MKIECIALFASGVARQHSGTYRDGNGMYAGDLATLLNMYLQTRYQRGRRGIYTVLRAIYSCLVRVGLQKEADIVAETFVDKSGKPAWLKERRP
jgi:hypothetical protein